jgi:two-component system, OmpR family, phosphate regulon sensor histidine kinase PhoR
MRLATRLFAASSLLVALTVVGLVLAADRILRRELEDETARALEREARLVLTQLSPDSLTWAATAQRLGALIGHRVTLIDSTGRVRGDTEFPKDALGGLENHGHRPEVLEALKQGIGENRRLSVSTNQRRLYVAISGGPPPLDIVRLSTTLAAVDAQVDAVQEAIAIAGLLAILLAALLAWIGSRHLARPLVELTAAARAIAEERTPTFPDSGVLEVSRHILALRAMHEQLDRRFVELRRERAETAELVEAMADAVIAAEAGGTILTCNAAARRLLRLGPM